MRVGSCTNQLAADSGSSDHRLYVCKQQNIYVRVFAVLFGKRRDMRIGMWAPSAQKWLQIKYEDMVLPQLTNKISHHHPTHRNRPHLLTKEKTYQNRYSSLDTYYVGASGSKRGKVSN